MDDVFRAAYGRAVHGGSDAVDAAASVLAAEPDWDTVAARCAEHVTGDCVRRGWSPPDLVRMAARELGPRHARLAEAFPAEGLGDFARTERLDRFSAATTVVELLGLYGRLPRIAALTPPGQGTAAPKMLARIRALLAKAESTGFPEIGRAHV